MNCLIISGGKFCKCEIKKSYDLIIACDKGHLYAKKLNVKPDVVIGDFDSSKQPRDKSFVIAVDKIKDDTDTSLAVKYALRNGYKNIDIICALGYRIDHTVANISLLRYIYENGGNGVIISDDAKIFVIGEGNTKIKKEKNSFLSIFSLTDKSYIKYIKGTKYDTKGIVLKNIFPLGVSNEFVKDTASISVKKGVLLVILAKEDDVK